MIAEPVQLHARDCAPRCPVCREDLAATTELLRASCPCCGVTQHVPCVVEIGGCATFGCPTSSPLAVDRGRWTSPYVTTAWTRATRTPTRHGARRLAAPAPRGRSPARLVLWSLACTPSLPLAFGTWVAVLLCYWTSRPPAIVSLIVYASLLLAIVANCVGACLAVSAGRKATTWGPRAGAVIAGLLNIVPWIAALCEVMG